MTGRARGRPAKTPTCQRSSHVVRPPKRLRVHASLIQWPTPPINQQPSPSGQPAVQRDNIADLVAEGIQRGVKLALEAMSANTQNSGSQPEHSICDPGNVVHTPHMETIRVSHTLKTNQVSHLPLPTLRSWKLPLRLTISQSLSLGHAPVSFP